MKKIAKALPILIILCMIILLVSCKSSSITGTYDFDSVSVSEDLSYRLEELQADYSRYSLEITDTHLNLIYDGIDHKVGYVQDGNRLILDNQDTINENIKVTCRDGIYTMEVRNENGGITTTIFKKQ